MQRSERQTARVRKEISIRGGSFRPRGNARGNQQKVVVPRRWRASPGSAARRAHAGSGRWGEVEITVSWKTDQGRQAILLISSESGGHLDGGQGPGWQGHISGEFEREEATQENVMTAATGGTVGAGNPGRNCRR